MRTPRRTRAGCVEKFDQLRTKPEAKRALARWGWAGEIGGFSNIVFSLEARPYVVRPTHEDEGETRSGRHVHRY